MGVKVTKAVIAAAGFGTRFLPQTKAMPKEMLPLVDKPIIQYVVEELVEAGIKDIIIVTGYHKRSLEDHFDSISADLMQNLVAGNKDDLLKEVQKISELANFAYIRQKGPYGNATPILNAEHLLGNESFIYAFADDFVRATPARFKQMVDVHTDRGGSILTCVKATKEDDYTRYGFVGGVEVEAGLIDVAKIIEKPGSKALSPSDTASVSGYIFEPAIFEYLHKQKEALPEGKEFALQESLQSMINDGKKVYGYNAKNSKYYDTGNKLDYLKTVVDFALQHDDISDEFRAYLKAVLN